MAIYTGATLRYRGRLIDVRFRYGVYNGVSITVGKPLNFTRRDIRKIQKLVRCKPTVQQQLDAQYEAIDRFC